MNKLFQILLITVFISFTHCKPTDNKNIVNANLNKDTIKLIPVDKKTKKGVLANGMTYYLHSTGVTKGVASYYIIQNVGSILEDENQQGLAHFLEHMAFNGTKAFPGKSMLNTLQKQGLIFGRDINAYTGFDETVYNVDFIPTTPKLTDIGLQILHDWSNGLLLTEEEIDAERGVIKEEWRTRQNGNMRIMKQTATTTFGNSKYTNRFPIGLMSIVDNFEYKALRDFYKNWYRTDLQAIAIVGDFDINEMEAKVKAKFSSIPAIKNPPKRVEVLIKDNQKLDYAIGMDKEITNAFIAFKIRHLRKLDDTNYNNLREGLIDYSIRTILNERFKEISQTPEAPFLGVGTGYSPLPRMHNNFSINISPKPNKQQEAFSLAMKELNRAVKFGFTKSELQRVIIGMKSFYENEISKQESKQHWQIIERIKKDYLENKTIVDIAEEYKVAQSIFSELSTQDLLGRLKELYTKKNRSVVVTGVKDQDNLTKEDALKTIESAENDTTLKPYKNETSLGSLMSGISLKAGSINSENKNSDLNFTTITLSNGIKVYYKYVNKNKNSVNLEAISKGGKSLIAKEDLPALSLILPTASSSGLGNFSATELPKVIAGKNARTMFSIKEIEESINGESTTVDVETMLQMVNLRFTKPRFTKTGLSKAMLSTKSYLRFKSGDLNSKMRDSITTTLYGNNNPIKFILNKDLLSGVTLDKVKAIYKDRFSNASDFNFFIVGDVKLENLKPLLKKYIASIPTKNEKEQWKNNSVNWNSKHTKKDIYLPMGDPKTSVNIAIKKEMPYSLKDELTLKALKSILQLRYTASLREEEGGTYGAATRALFSKKPYSFAYLAIKFDCNPDLTDKLVGIVYKELEKIKQGDIKQEDIDKTKTSFLKTRNDAKNVNSYDLEAIKNYVLEDYNMTLPENFETIVNSISKESLQDLTLGILTDYKSFEVIFKPIEQ